MASVYSQELETELKGIVDKRIKLLQNKIEENNFLLNASNKFSAHLNKKIEDCKKDIEEFNKLIEKSFYRIDDRRIKLLQKQIEKNNFLLNTSNDFSAHLNKEIEDCKEEIERYKAMSSREALMYILMKDIKFAEDVINGKKEDFQSELCAPGMSQKDLDIIHSLAMARSSEQCRYGEDGATIKNLESKNEGELLTLLRYDNDIQKIESSDRFPVSMFLTLCKTLETDSEMMDRIKQIKKKKFQALKVQLIYKEREIKELENKLVQCSQKKYKTRKNIDVDYDALVEKKDKCIWQQRIIESNLTMWQQESEQDVLYYLINHYQSASFYINGILNREKVYDDIYTLFVAFQYMSRGDIRGNQRLEKLIIEEMCKREDEIIEREIPQYMQAYTCFSVADAFGLQADLEAAEFYGNRLRYKKNCPTEQSVKTIMSLPEDKQAEFYAMLEKYAKGKWKKNKFFSEAFDITSMVGQGGLILSSLAIGLLSATNDISFGELFNAINVSVVPSIIVMLAGDTGKRFCRSTRVDYAVDKLLEKMNRNENRGEK